MITFKMNNGIEIPAVGSGTNTYGKVDKDYSGAINFDKTELNNAIALGYRHFDTAISYRNEAVVGQAINESNINRQEFFITSKIPGEPEYTDNDSLVDKAVQSSLEALNTDYIDLYLIHHPWDDLDDMVRVWKRLEYHVQIGNLKSIGVSNFDEAQLTYLINHATIKPVVNQIESHPGHWNHDIIEASLKLDVLPEAWGPVKKVTDEAKAILTEIGNSYCKTWAQVILAYQIQRRVIVIPKSHNKERQKQNLEIFDFKLTTAEIETIAKL